MKRSSGAADDRESKLHEIYTTVLTASLPTSSIEGYDEEYYAELRLILGSIIVLFTAVSIGALGKLLAAMRDEVEETLGRLLSILDVPKDPDVRRRCYEVPFSDKTRVHRMIVA